MRKKLIAGSIFLIVLVSSAGYFLNRKLDATQIRATAEKKPLYWIDPMEPKVHYPGPGKSSMGMDVVPVFADDEGTENNGVRISSTTINNLGVRTAPVIRGKFSRQINTVGYVEPNENKIVHIYTYAEGWIRKLVVKTVGQLVKQGELLLQLYSPMLINAQDEFLIALETNNQQLIAAAHQKLKTLNISDSQIDQVKNNKKSEQLINIYSPQNGIVQALNVREGARVLPETDLMTIVDLSSIWIIAQILEKEAEWVKINQEGTATLIAYPGREWKVKVEYIYPEVDSATRTVKVRFRLDNAHGTFKPNMYANITLLVSPQENVLSIPEEALIRNSQGNRVIVALGNGRFKAQEVTIGTESNDRIQILSGLKENENVVVSGQFLIDSESNLKATTDKMEELNNAQKITTLIKGEGVVESVDNINHILKLKHEAITDLNMPVMSMDFKVLESILISDINVGDKIQFTLEKMQNKELVIVNIKKLSN